MAIVINPISPVAVSIFGFDIRWYALAYVMAFVVGYFMVQWMTSEKTGARFGFSLTKKQLDDLLTAMVIGVILGGRLGYVLFYNLSFFLAHPMEIFAVWKGGMSFHGGMLGVIVSVFCMIKIDERKKIKESKKEIKSLGIAAWARESFKILDVLAVVAPIGLFFGRIANFINMEVMGRATEKSWGIVFNGFDSVPRHASPLYEAATEGFLLFIIMFGLWRFTKIRENVGALSGVAAILYALFRIFCEQFRAPDAHIGFLTSWGLTMGQLLSAGMILAGAGLIYWGMRRK